MLGKKKNKSTKKRTKVYRGYAKLVNKEPTNVDPVNIVVSPVNNPNNTQPSPPPDTTPSTPLSTVSARKVKPIQCVTPSKFNAITGYRFVDIEILSLVIYHCYVYLECSETNMLTLSESIVWRKGFASSLKIECKGCRLVHEFCDSNNKGLDINKRTVYAIMRACGQGHSGLSTFTAMMDMPGAMTARNYDKIVTKFSAIVKTVAE